MAEQFGHEKLRVYGKAVGFVAYAERLIGKVEDPVAARDHLERASESIVLQIAEGNGRRTARDRAHRFDIAYGSALECAGCLDVLLAKECLGSRDCEEGKDVLSTIVRMLVGLRRSDENVVRERHEGYGASNDSSVRVYFSHENLHVYKRAVEFVKWCNGLGCYNGMPIRCARNLDTSSTSIVLNIAEGNGRFAVLDHTRFLDISHASALRAASYLDVLAAKDCLDATSVMPGKTLLREIVSMLVAMRASLLGGAEDT